MHGCISRRNHFSENGTGFSDRYFFDVGGDKSGILSEIVQKTGTENSETMQIKRNGYGEGQKKRRFLCRLKEKKAGYRNSCVTEDLQ